MGVSIGTASPVLGTPAVIVVIGLTCCVIVDAFIAGPEQRTQSPREYPNV